MWRLLASAALGANILAPATAAPGRCPDQHRRG